MHNPISNKVVLPVVSFVMLLVSISFTVVKQHGGHKLESFRNVSDFVDENEECFKCHGESEYQYLDDSTSKYITGILDEGKIINREDYYRSNHRSFSCIDCHPDKNEQHPFPDEPEDEIFFTCINCHGNMDNNKQYQFEKIEEEYFKSIHYKTNPFEFSCWKCHNPHTYHISIRNTKNLLGTIAYDNGICLSCHADNNSYELQKGWKDLDLVQHHSWLPNQALHFMNVRCIDCHTQINDNMLVAHLILPKEEAVHHCTECHSSNSILLSTLYKFQSKENRNKFGFFNAVVINDVYLIGAGWNYLLNLISLIIFGLTFMGIMYHITVRIIKMNKN